MSQLPLQRGAGDFGHVGHVALLVRHQGAVTVSACQRMPLAMRRHPFGSTPRLRAAAPLAC
ncbi:hypothetical protein [Streptomyces avermitilis]|uniref:hypothetical protein n=1 Tax=Streptomyces avermitilis TaxID=33903 RepID=UPI00371AD98E